MERPKYTYRTGDNTCTLPTGWIAVPLHQYRSEIKELTAMVDRIDMLDDDIARLKKEKLDIEWEFDLAKERLDELEKFLREEPYAVNMLDRWREKQQKPQEKDHAEAEDF